MTDKQVINGKRKSRPATKDDNIDIVAVDINQIVKEGEKPRIEIANSTVVQGISSMDLDKGVTIKVGLGGNPNKKIEKNDEMTH